MLNPSHANEQEYDHADSLCAMETATFEGRDERVREGGRRGADRQTAVTKGDEQRGQMMMHFSTIHV